MDFDLLIIGGGINGAAIAREAAGRGLSVLLCEKGDLGGETSSASTKLIHGGLRYLENFEFRMVRHALREREMLLKTAPHLVWPARFILPHSGRRPARLVRLGLFIYDHLYASSLPKSRAIHLEKHPAGAALKESRRHRAFVYSDCRTDDARLVILNCLAARELGATIRPRTACIGLKKIEEGWRATLQAQGGGEEIITARAVANAAGPWVAEVAGMAMETPPNLRLVRGTHIVVPALFDHEFSYLLQHTDGRVIFALPYMEKFTLVGTTDAEQQADTREILPSKEEISYLCQAVNRYFERRVEPEDVLWAFAGVRPLVGGDETGEARKASRDWALQLEGVPPFLNVLGGKLTTHRELAAAAVNKLASALPGISPPQPPRPLPGGNLPPGGLPALEQELVNKFTWLREETCRRLARAYGSQVWRVFANVGTEKDAGEHLGHGLYEVEARYLLTHEWAKTTEDILWRRTKLGLTGGKGLHKNLTDWLLKNA